MPKELPSHGSRVLVATDGHVWVEESRSPADAASTAEWSVFTADGILLGQVALPLRFVPHEIGVDYVLGVWRDALDVEHVQLFGLLKRGL